ncbi:MAG: hypothetical protein ACXVZ4_05105, partial [Gaiellaceae bacterium]
AAAAAEAERILVEARRNAAAERARAEEERRRAATSEAAAIEAAGRAEAERVAARGRERLPALVSDVVASLDSGAPRRRLDGAGQRAQVPGSPAPERDE